MTKIALCPPTLTRNFPKVFFQINNFSVKVFITKYNLRVAHKRLDTVLFFKTTSLA